MIFLPPGIPPLLPVSWSSKCQRYLQAETSLFTGSLPTVKIFLPVRTALAFPFFTNMHSIITKKHTEELPPLYIVRESAKVVMIRTVCEQQLFSVIYDRYYKKVLDFIRVLDASSRENREDI